MESDLVARGLRVLLIHFLFRISGKRLVFTLQNGNRADLFPDVGKKGATRRLLIYGKCTIISSIPGRRQLHLASHTLLHHIQILQGLLPGTIDHASQ